MVSGRFERRGDWAETGQRGAGTGRGLVKEGRGLGRDWANHLSFMLSKGANSVKAISSKRDLVWGIYPNHPRVWKELMGKGSISNPVVNGTRVAPAGAGGAGPET